jgi:hypothetical protein
MISNRYYDCSTRNGGCEKQALRLKSLNAGSGGTYWVSQKDRKWVLHAYYVPDIKRSDEKALNQADNGYEGYPALSVGEVIASGHEFN